MTQKEELKDQLINLIEDYKRRLHTVNEMIKNDTSNGSLSAIKRTERLNTKASEYRTFISELKRTLTGKIEAENPLAKLESMLTPITEQDKTEISKVLKKPEPAKSAEKPQCKFFPCKSVSDCTHCGDYLKPEPVGSAERVKFNVNHYVYIQINERGWERLQNSVGADYITHCINPYRTVIKGEYWYRLQLHQVFELFPIDMAHPILFNPNIMFEVTEALQSNKEKDELRCVDCKHNSPYDLICESCQVPGTKFEAKQ